MSLSLDQRQSALAHLLNTAERRSNAPYSYALAYVFAMLTDEQVLELERFLDRPAV